MQRKNQIAEKRPRLYHKNNFHYWFYKIRNLDVDEILFGNMDGKMITINSVVIYVGILNSQKGVFKAGWSVHTDVNMTLGYLKYIILPSSFYTWIDEESQGFYIPLSPYEIVKEEVLKNYSDKHVKETQKFDGLIHYIDSIWEEGEEEKYIKLKRFCHEFNEMFNEDSYRKLYIRIFKNCGEIVDFILGDEVQGFKEVIEEEIGMTIDQLRFMCKNVYTQPLLNKRFIQHLNNQIPICF